MTLVWKSRYEAAWSGSLEKIVRHSDNAVMGKDLAPQIEEAQAGTLFVITTVRRIAELFRHARYLYGPGPWLTHPERDPLWFGGWFTGEEVQAPHLLVLDHGPWTGGGGDQSVVGGATLIRVANLPAPVEHALELACQRMKSDSFRGLFAFDVSEDLIHGKLEVRNHCCGWNSPGVLAFIAEAEQQGQCIAGVEPARLRHRFVSVLPVSIPPWPSEKRSEEEAGKPIEGLTVQQQGQCFWFDIAVNEERKQLLSAGLDGLLCVATGHSDSTPALARARALELAHKLQIPGKQYRLDLGSLVDRVLSTLEDRYGFIA